MSAENLSWHFYGRKLMKNILYSEQNIKKFDINKFMNSLRNYGWNGTEEEVLETLKEFDQYENLHYSCLIEVAMKLIPDDEEAYRYYQDHPYNELGFERLRRITGYLVGTLERWNDAKKAEEKARVKHSLGGQYTPDEKAEIEALKQAQLEAKLSQEKSVDFNH